MFKEKPIKRPLIASSLLALGFAALAPAQENKASAAFPGAKEELLGELSLETSVPGPDIARGRGWKGMWSSPDVEPDYFIDPISLRFAARAKQGKGWVLVVDGKERGPTFEGVKSLLLSPGGEHVNYSAKRGSKWVKVLDDKELGPAFDELGGGFWFWGDAALQRYAYAAKRGKQWLVVTDGNQGSEFDEVGRPVFSPDGQHLAYKAKRGKKWLIVADGGEGPEFEEVSRPVFRAGGRHLVYWAKRGRKRELIVVDGKEGPDFEEVRLPNFNSDAQRLAFAAKRGKKWLAVADDKEGPAFLEVGSVSFSSDSRHLA